MTATLRQIALLIGKDLRIEARNRHTVSLILVLGLLIVIVLGLGLSSQFAGGAVDAGRKTAGATAALWVAYLFAGVLCFEKTMAVERQDGAMAALLLAPIDRGVLYVGKLATNLILMFGLAAVVTPAGVMLLGFQLPSAVGTYLAIVALGMVGFAAIGTLFAAAVSSTRLRGGLLALVVFPLCLPLIIASTQMAMKLSESLPGADSGAGGTQLAILLAFDLIYLVMSWLVFELVLEP